MITVLINQLLKTNFTVLSREILSVNKLINWGFLSIYKQMKYFNWMLIKSTLIYWKDKQRGDESQARGGRVDLLIE